ncbi:MAG: hypothetical protein AAF657_35425 [Acidobacteriota bacterium]
MVRKDSDKLLLAAIVANVLMLAVWAYAALLREVSKDFYYLSAQEDEYIEWGTFWAFSLAAAVWIVAALAQRREEGRLPWFLFGLSVFCFAVAMEEISWGQRVFGYRPPVYFLENNFQQELNLHNVVPTDFRKLALKGIILGYGVVLPLLAWMAPLRRLLATAAIVVPPLALAPAFFATYYFYEDYPWSLSGEWVELMLGLGFLFAALAALDRDGVGARIERARSRPIQVIVVAWATVIALGVAQASLSRVLRRANPEMIETARGELEALKRDFLSGKVRTRCSRHKRLYTFKEQYNQDYLVQGEFAALTDQGLPDERAQFLLDPWNSPYWIRDRCKSNGSRRVVFVYSFGPNRRRESSRYEIQGDDVGVVIYDGKKIADITRGR